MGHSRLGSVPKTEKWNVIVKEFFSADKDHSSVDHLLSKDIERISKMTLDAVQTGLDKAINDVGLRYTFFLLTQLVLSARESNWDYQLSNFDIDLSENINLFDLTTEIHHSIDKYVTEHGHATDVSEIAQKAAGEALSMLVGPKSVTLFGSGQVVLKNAFRELSTKKGFSQLGRQFFGNFIAHYLNFYLSRITASNIGKQKLQHVGDLVNFNEALQNHCYQSARIVSDFCGEWYSKTEFQEGINYDNASRFIAVALKKLKNELKLQRDNA